LLVLGIDLVLVLISIDHVVCPYSIVRLTTALTESMTSIPSSTVSDNSSSTHVDYSNDCSVSTAGFVLEFIDDSYSIAGARDAALYAAVMPLRVQLCMKSGLTGTSNQVMSKHPPVAKTPQVDYQVAQPVIAPAVRDTTANGRGQTAGISDLQDAVTELVFHMATHSTGILQLHSLPSQYLRRSPWNHSISRLS
jgi:hypothetical protein